MNTRPWRLSAVFALSGLAAAALAACVVAGGGSGYGGDVEVGVGYYEPFGGVYNTWSPGYEVGPYRDGGHGWNRGPGSHPYRSPGAGHSAPSIPSHPRGRR